MKQNYGDFLAQEVSGRIGTPVASVTEMKTIPADRRVNGQLFYNLADGTVWRYHSSSALTGNDILVATPGAGSGRFLRVPGAGKFEMPITFATADAAILMTMQAGQELLVLDLFWRVDVSFTGGTTPAIGVSSSNKTAPTNWTTKGDLLGGASGDLTATLVSSTGIVAGTVGADMDTVAKRRGAIWKNTETFRFDRIADAFAAGSGAVVIEGILMRNDGA